MSHSISRTISESKRANLTIASPIIDVAPLFGLKTKDGSPVSNMGQGMVHWGPPSDAKLSAVAKMDDFKVHVYGHVQGHPQLRQALLAKCQSVNGITNKEIFVSPGSNQAFANVVAAICDPGDEVIIFTPYYFNHHMALTLANVTPVLVPLNDHDNLPNLETLPSYITSKTKAIVLISPNNPTGTICPPELSRAMQQLCEARGLVFISDEAYEAFIYDEVKHISPKGPNVINLFSFSKGFGMAGYRVGYSLVPPSLAPAVAKAADTYSITTSLFSQLMALESVTMEVYMLGDVLVCAYRMCVLVTS